MEDLGGEGAGRGDGGPDPMALAAACRKYCPPGFEGLAAALGRDPEGFEEAVRESCPECAAWMDRRLLAGALGEAKLRVESGGEAGAAAMADARRLRLLYIEAAVRSGGFPGEEWRPAAWPEAAGQEPEAPKPARPRAVRKANAPKADKALAAAGPLGPVPAGLVEGPMAALAEGVAAVQYGGRPVVAFRIPAGGVFGTGLPRSGCLRLMTVRGGVPNGCQMAAGGPSRSWAVLDAMCGLREFTKGEALDLAAPLCGGGRRLAGNAFDQVKGHHRHPRMKRAGMAHMVEDLGGGRMRVRARTAEETLQYFESGASRRLKFGEAPEADGRGPVSAVAGKGES